MSNILSKEIIGIFAATFLLVFIVLTMVEPNMTCKDTENSLFPECKVQNIGGDFILGLAISAVLLLLDLGLVYILISDLVI